MRDRETEKQRNTKTESKETERDRDRDRYILPDCCGGTGEKFAKHLICENFWLSRFDKRGTTSPPIVQRVSHVGSAHTPKRFSLYNNGQIPNSQPTMIRQPVFFLLLSTIFISAQEISGSNSCSVDTDCRVVFLKICALYVSFLARNLCWWNL